MPSTQLQFPILLQFLCAVENTTGMPPQPLNASPSQLDEAQKNQDGDERPKQLPRGVVLGPDGKPCRSCTSFASWAAMTKQQNPTATSSISKQSAMPIAPPAECPPDVDELGRSTWTLLHTITANYPERPSIKEQVDMKQFISLFSRFYPCWVCADDFREWMKAGNEPKVSNRDEFGKWMCEAHNAVNVKLGKNTFDCNKWAERWRTGWKDGSCD